MHMYGIAKEVKGVDNQTFDPKPPPLDIKRVLWAAVLISIVLMLHSHLFPPSPSTQQPTPPTNKAPTSPQSNNKQQQQKIPPPIDHAATKHPPIPLTTWQFTSNLTALYQATVSNQGAQINHLTLTGYTPPVVLTGYPSSQEGLLPLVSRNSSITLNADSMYEILHQENKSVTLRHTTIEDVAITRRYDFSDKQFIVKQTIHVQNRGKQTRLVALDSVMTDAYSEKDKTGWFSPPKDDSRALCFVGDKAQRWSWDDLKQPVLEKGGVLYGGIDKRYFVLAAMSQSEQKMVIEACRIERWQTNDTQDVKGTAVYLQHPQQRLEPGQEVTWNMQVYVGPKQLSRLRQAGHALQTCVDFGWFGVLSRPMLWLLVLLNGWAHNFGLAIVLLTLVIKLLTFPLTYKSFVSMQQMKTISPQLKQLQAQYGHDRALMGQKQMELYKKTGVNPMAGCLPLLIQMPIWFALYQMLWNAVELYGQPLGFWIVDLTKPDPYYTLPLVMGASLFVQQALQPTVPDQPQMKYVMWGMPIALTGVMMNMPAGLSLYILTNNVLTIVQQAYIKKIYPSST
ncbi:MAG: membrane protein insertase YidC [Myxococcota bacterium]